MPSHHNEPKDPAGDRLRATAADFVPLLANANETQKAVGRRRSQTYAQPHRHPRRAPTGNTDPSDDSFKPTNSKNTFQSSERIKTPPKTCPVCIELGLGLPCCLTFTGSCATCTKFGEALETRKTESDDKLAALQARNKILETETAEQRYKRLCEEKNSEIESLKVQVEAAEKQDRQLKAQVKAGRADLGRLRDELLKLQPKKEAERQEFVIKEVKQKKGSKK